MRLTTSKVIMLKTVLKIKRIQFSYHEVNGRVPEAVSPGGGFLIQRIGSSTSSGVCRTASFWAPPPGFSGLFEQSVRSGLCVFFLVEEVGIVHASWQHLDLVRRRSLELEFVAVQVFQTNWQ